MPRADEAAAGLSSPPRWVTSSYSTQHHSQNLLKEEHIFYKKINYCNFQYYLYSYTDNLLNSKFLLSCKLRTSEINFFHMGYPIIKVLMIFLCLRFIFSMPKYYYGARSIHSAELVVATKNKNGLHRCCSLCGWARASHPHVILQTFNLTR